ncbi:MAG: metallophosphoesterase, partial [Opitutales bacterium]|nr:metallophosphoesterase [Opitutales bacterium]
TKQEQLESLKKTFLKNRKDGDFSFAFATDTHYHSSPDKTKKLSTSADHMRDMAKVAKELKLSFVANGGDMVNGARPKDESLKDLREIVGAMAESDLPVLITIGNHDDGVFWALKTFKKSDLSQVVTGAEWHDACVAPALKKGAVGDKNFDKANYFYMDFPEAKIRFINMAVSENPMTINKKGRFAIDSCGLYAISQRQLEWLATQALDFSGKPDAKEWAVIFMSHCRLSDMKLFMGVVEAFTKGGSFSGATKTGHFPAKISCDFSAQGPIPVVLNIAGHVHTDNLAHTKLGYLGATMMNDCNRSRVFERVPGQANDAAWTIITLNRKENRATFLRFGAGSDMEAPLIKAPSGKKPPRRAR